MGIWTLGAFPKTFFWGKALLVMSAKCFVVFPGTLLVNILLGNKNMLTGKRGKCAKVELGKNFRGKRKLGVL